MDSNFQCLKSSMKNFSYKSIEEYKWKISLLNSKSKEAFGVAPNDFDIY